MVVGEWGSRNVFLFLSSLFNKFEILDYKKTVRLGRGVIGDVSKKAYEKSRIWM